MRVRWLGWAGVEIEVDGAALVIDPLEDAGATFAPLGEETLRRVKLPTVVPPEGPPSVAGLVTHLHRDHTDAPALARALAPGAPVYEPVWPGGEDAENAALAQANAELGQARLERRAVEPWETAEAGPFSIAALPAVDGLGEPQVSWLVEADGQRILHLGDTIYHAYWWRMVRRHGAFDVVLAPINGARVNFPHLQPPSPLAAALEPEQAAVVGELLGARTLVPIHYDGYSVDPWYLPVDDPGPRFEAATEGRSYEARRLEPGESFEVAAVPVDA